MRWRLLGRCGSRASNRPDLKLDVASVVAGYLVDPAAGLETRAWAAWALGMMRVGQQVSLQLSLAGYEVGDLAVTSARRSLPNSTIIADNFDDDEETRPPDLTALLLFQVIPPITGDEGFHDSGLLRSTHPSAAVGQILPDEAR